MVPDPQDDQPEPPKLRALRLMVTGLTGVLILAVITVVTVLVIRLAQTPRAVTLTLPDTVTLPAGETAQAATLGRDWVLVVTRDREGVERARLFDGVSGAPLSEMVIETR